jgi:hypothetical protein
VPLARAVKLPDGRVEMVTQPLPPSCRMIMPCRWTEGGLGEFAGRVRFRRRFGIPRHLDAHEVVWLTFAGADAVAFVTLNGQFLGRSNQPLKSFEFEVTGLLRERNELLVDVEAPSGDGGLWGEVALEVRCAAFLRGVCATKKLVEGAVKLHIRGEAVGTWDRPLDLYALLDRSTIAYSTIQPTTEGQRFDILSEDIQIDRWERLRAEGKPTEVLIDLVNGAIVWYTMMCPLE